MTSTTTVELRDAEIQASEDARVDDGDEVSSPFSSYLVER
jgi:hypothetical protein